MHQSLNVSHAVIFFAAVFDLGRHYWWGISGSGSGNRGCVFMKVHLGSGV